MNPQELTVKRARCGKIARLPVQIREQLNRHLENNCPASAILPWLNALPETRQILHSQFNDMAITKQNLSEWRHGGYEEWLIREDIRAQIAAHLLLKAAPTQSDQNPASQT
jgi:hypothetical protein